MGHRNRHKPFGKIAHQRDDLVEFLTNRLYNRSKQLHRALTYAELEETLVQAINETLNWLKETDQQHTSPFLTGSLAEREAFSQGQKALIAKIGTDLLRLRQRLIDPDTGSPLEDMRSAYRHFQFVWGAIHEAGYTIQDHTGQPYIDGQQLKVSAYEQKPGIRRKLISETIKPSIYYQKEDKTELIQIGEVIVSGPVAGKDQS